MTEIVVTSSVLISAVLLIRFIFKGKISRRLQYGLWIPVVIRLLMPFSISAPVSVMNAVDTTPAEQFVMSQSINVSQNTPVSTESEDGPTSAETVPVSSMQPSDIFRAVWLSGSAAVGIWFAAVNLTFYAKLKKSRRKFEAENVKLPIYIVPSIPSPCLFGLFHPAIYLTEQASLNPQILRHAVTHELCHYAQLDHIWSVVRGLCVTIHWFNPLVWAAAACSRFDCELACDESAVKQLGDEEKIAYGRTLIELVTIKTSPSALVSAATTMTSSGKRMKERIAMITKSPKTIAAALAVLLVLLLAVVGCTFTGADTSEDEKRFQGDYADRDYSGIEILDADGKDISDTAIDLWYAASDIYDVDGATMFEQGDWVTLLDNFPEFIELKNYDEVVKSIFTDHGIGELEASTVTLIQKVGGKVYRLGPWGTGYSYAYAMVDMQKKEASENTVTVTVEYIKNAGYVGEEEENSSDAPEYGTVDFTLAKENGVWLADSYTYPGTVSPLFGYTAAEFLALSIQAENGILSFTIPAAYADTQDWDIRISGSIKNGDSNTQVQLFEEENANQSWQAGKTYTIDTTEQEYQSLRMEIYLRSDSTVAKSIDLLTVAEKDSSGSGSESGGGEQESEEARVYFDNLSAEDEKLYQQLTQQRGLKEWQIHSLTNTGFAFQDIISLSDKEIAEILAPGASFMGDTMSEEEFYKLVDSGMPEDDVYILQNLGYDYDSIIALTPEQMDFIFPNTELVDNLVALGYDRNVVEAVSFLYDGGWETYKELLDEVFATYSPGQPLSALQYDDGPVPEFLNEEQQTLYRLAKTAFMEFTLENAGFGSGWDDDGGDAYNYPLLEQNEMAYYKCNGTITKWADFETAMLALFTPEYFQELNNGASYTDGDGVFHQRTIFAEQNGDLYYSGGARGGNITFIGPETFELISETDTEIQFYVVGTYDDFAEDAQGNLIEDENGDYRRAENPTQEKYLLRMEKGTGGWRFSEFHLAY